MSKTKKLALLILGVFILASVLLGLFLKFKGTSYLTFSDGAKFGLIARSLVQSGDYVSDFTFYTPALLGRTDNFFSPGGVPVLVPYTLSMFFRVLGVSDFSVILFSGSFYVLLVIGVFLLGRKIYGNLVGALSALAVAANRSALDYAVSGASESLYMFLTVASAYLIFLKKKWASALFFLSLVLIYLSKPQGVVFIASILFVWFILNFSWRKGIVLFAVVIAAVLAVDKLILYPLSFKYPVYPIVTRGVQAVFQYSPTTAVSDALRGQGVAAVGWSDVLKKTFYNLYNFYKLLPEILSPYLFGFFVIGMFIRFKNNAGRAFSVLSLLVFIGTFLLAALSIPFYRYLHPVIPLVYVAAVGTLVTLVSKLEIKSAVRLYVCTFLVLIFGAGQTLGVIFLDSRFERNTHNMGKPPVYVKLSETLKENTNEDQVVVTNLDTWGSWYGERRTVWFPLEPNQLISPNDQSIPFDAIYLTSYLMDDDNYRMGESWRQIFENPNEPSKWKCNGCEIIADEFKLAGAFKINAGDNYERQDASAILLVKK